MSKRKDIPCHVRVSVAIRQAWQSTAAGCEFFACGLCRQPLNAYEPRILEHMTPRATLVALGMDPDTPANLYWVHAECAAKKTNGTKATTAGSDKHMIAKAKRFDKINAGERSRKRKGPPLKSRPFPKVSRPFRRAP